MSKIHVHVQCCKIQCGYCERTFTIQEGGSTEGHFKCEEYVHMYDFSLSLQSEDDTSMVSRRKGEGHNARVSPMLGF